VLSVRNEQSKYDRLRTNGEVGCEAVEEFTPVRTEREERTDQVKTTLAGRSYLKLIKRLQLANWEIKLIYLALSNVKCLKNGWKNEYFMEGIISLIKILKDVTLVA